MKVRNFYYFTIDFYFGVLTRFRRGVIAERDIYEVIDDVVTTLHAINQKYGVLPKKEFNEWIKKLKKAETIDEMYYVLIEIWDYLQDIMEKEIGSIGIIDEELWNLTKKISIKGTEEDWKKRMLGGERILLNHGVILNDIVYLDDEGKPAPYGKKGTLTFAVASESTEKFYGVVVPFVIDRDKVRTNIRKATCTCPDNAKNGYTCKHILATAYLLYLEPDIYKIMDISKKIIEFLNKNP